MSLTDSATLTKPLRIDVRARRWERRLGVLALLAAPVATFLLALPPLAAALFCMVASSAVLIGLWWHGWLAGARRLTNVAWLSDGSWLLTDAARTTIPATLSAGSRVGNGWLWLRWHTGVGMFSPGLRQRCMLILQGDIAPADLRRLTVRLRLESVSRRDAQAPLAGVCR